MSFPCNSRTERKAGSPVFPTALPAPDSITPPLFSPFSTLPSPAAFPRFFFTNQPLRIPSQMIKPKTIRRTTTGMATAMARVLVETPPPPPPPPLLLLRSSLVPPPAVSVVESVVAPLEPDAVELLVLEVGPVEVAVLDAWSCLSSPSLVAIHRRQQTSNPRKSSSRRQAGMHAQVRPAGPKAASSPSGHCDARSNPPS